ncbi:hypothetical protein GCM10023219_23650 [Stakelama sediminis]|uniref:ElaB/YqjD/DUF883 family membrane-anchored ribosome-binding protein n=1 Tax=Stakelama sediminis TaxID=463200 RepID=A0A840YZ40_9SPHN|nr:hypothetical protein [Stakelama sediminis]MBB5718958.1 ElaB/YqjD/DUF883 family membrane-anchored ribosome-binding protein [Stakelama sediminis]
MTDKKIPAEPLKDGPGAAAPRSDDKPVAAKNTAPKPAKPAKDSGDRSEPKATAKSKLKSEAGKLSKQAQEKARGYADQGKTKATGTLHDVSKLIGDAAGDVDTRFGKQYGQYAHSAADAVSGFADTLRDKDVDDLVEEAREFVRKSPALAVGIAAAAGFVIARILRSGIDSAMEAED